MSLRARYAMALTAAIACQRAATPLAPPNNGLTPATHARFPIASGVHAVSCNVCHGEFDTFRQFDCLSCHSAGGTAHDRPVTDELHRSVVNAGYAFASDSCLRCHATGAKVPFDHAGVTSSCATCHDSGKPFDPLPVAGTGLDGGAFVHPDKSGNDCRACHTVQSWLGAQGAPEGVRDPSQDLQLTAQIPAYAGTSIASLTPQQESLPMPMSHRTGAVPVASITCLGCHANANSGSAYPGRLHAPLAALGLAQPNACLDCHLASMPAGFVGPVDSSRTPAGPAMKHDAVLWSNGAPSTARASPQECSLCHQAPAGGSGWATASRFHAQAQPSSCLDCHANSRPAALLTAPAFALPPGVSFDHAGVPGECASCHAGTSAWSGGLFHLPGSAAPASCLPCHEGERPTSTAGWSGSWQAPPFDYAGANGATHGAGQDCIACHAAPSAAVKTWAGGHFEHVATSTCIACHATQRPDLNGIPPSQIPDSTGHPFDHSLNGTGDCIGCHHATIARGSYASDAPIPGSDWRGGIGYPGSTLVSAASGFSVLQLALVRSPSSGLVTGTSAAQATLYSSMLHVSPALPAPLSAGPEGSPDYGKCWHCHAHDSSGAVTSYASGQYHAALANFQATPGGAVSPYPQPAGQCAGCHVSALPSGIVEKTELRPMDHAGVQQDCSSCHQQPGGSWGDGAFHANISPAPQECVACHYPVMAASGDVASGASYHMRHASAQVGFQSCQVCHASALAGATGGAPSAALWRPGALHASLSTQPAACNDCHAASQPAGLTQSAASYALAMGATSTNQRQWMSHASAAVVGKDCAVCHAADATAAAWGSSTAFHAAATPSRCSDCHGAGSTPGSGNNEPAGLTDSSAVTSAAADPSTGVSAGTHDQITHSDLNASQHDCNFCHMQAGPSASGSEWAQASFHQSFSAASPLVMNGGAARCSNCHLNVKPAPSFAAYDHSALTAAPGSADCTSCHTWPGTGSPSAPNWLGASAAPALVTLAGWTSGTSITSHRFTFAHPAASTYASCAQCHAGSDYTRIIDYNHDGLTSSVSIDGSPVSPPPNLGTSQYNATTNPTFCVACHNSGSPYVNLSALAFTISASTVSGSASVSTAATAALVKGMTVKGSGVPATAVTILSIDSATSFTLSAAANATLSPTSLTVTHERITQAAIGSHQDSASGQDCTSCHYVHGPESLRPPTPGLFSTGSISGG